ncbi:hypothetical protein ACIP1U_30205 [Cupriavidus sp. NPDC089707]|uniref:hypothetical protein n=1 Tax=Cupriavidus sp. NPDC089707 TaxID=3363963 RepID=UPI003817E929
MTVVPFRPGTVTQSSENDVRLACPLDEHVDGAEYIMTSICVRNDFVLKIDNDKCRVGAVVNWPSSAADSTGRCRRRKPLSDEIKGRLRIV